MPDEDAPADRPNFLFIMADDHASHAISCYARHHQPQRPVLNHTPHIDRIAEEGMRFDNCFCTNAICTPSRAVILTGKHSHHPYNQVYTFTPMDNTLPTVAKHLQAGGYQTAIVGKWHLGTGPEHCPTGFDYWKVLPGQGLYHDPVFFEKHPETPGGKKVREQGYVTDLITDACLDWLESRDPAKPFFLMCHHKAPHRSWETDAAHAQMFSDDLPLPESFDDPHATSRARANARMRVDADFVPGDLNLIPPLGHAFMYRMTPPAVGDLADYELVPYDPLTEEEDDPVRFESLAARKRYFYQRYMQKYLRVIAAIDDNVGRLLAYLDAHGLAENTVVMYTSDQGFFLGDHGWYDKRFMYEESLRMPFVVRYPRLVRPGSVDDHLVLNLDFAQTWLDLAGVPQPADMQGRSFRGCLAGAAPDDWRTAMYYRYWLERDGAHGTTAHYGVRTGGPDREAMKLIYYYADDMGMPDANRPLDGVDHQTHEPAPHPREWECFDLERDPFEMQNVYDDPAYAETIRALKAELHALQEEAGDAPYQVEEP